MKTFLEPLTPEEERKYINYSLVKADKNPDYDMDPGNDTRDNVFLLSVEEVKTLLTLQEERQCEGRATTRRR